MVSIKFYFRGGTLFKIGTKVRGRRKRNIFWEKSKDYRKFARLSSNLTFCIFNIFFII